jgi:ribosome biogenesis GTPase A/Flp pilus assembly protein TadD
MEREASGISVEPPNARSIIDTSASSLLSIIRRQRLDSDGALLESVNRLTARAASKQISLAVLGEFSAGKTTFINSLLDTDVLATGILPTTAVCTYISYGPEPACEVSLKDGRILQLTSNEVAAFSSEGSRSTDVEAFRLRLSAPILADGLIVVDTPGVNVNIDEHEAITERAIESSNACVFLMDARQPGKKTTIDFLRTIRPKVDKFFFVLNRADILDTSEQREALEYVKDALIRECGIPEPRVELLSSISSTEGPWGSRFEAFKQSLNEFMKSERDSVICADLARLLGSAIIRSERLLNSKFRLAEQELAAHYKTSMPDAVEIVSTLKKRVLRSVKNDIADADTRFSDLHASECRELRSDVAAIISSHSTIEALVKSAPNEISTTFEAHLGQLEAFITRAFERTFEDRRDEVTATFQELFSHVKWLEQKAYFSRIGGWIAVGAGLLLLPWFELRFHAPRQCLMISPFLGASAGIVIYGASYWFRTRSLFSPPKSPRIGFAWDVHSALRKGALFQNAANNPLEPNLAPFQIGRGVGMVAGNPWFAVAGAAIAGAVYGLQKLWEVASRKLERLRNEMRESLRPVLDSFEYETRKGATGVFISGKQRTITALSSLIEDAMKRYEIILDRVLKPHRQIRDALEQRRSGLREDATQLKTSRQAVLDSLRSLEIQLKGTASYYMEPDAIDFEEMTSNAPGTLAINISQMSTVEPKESSKSLTLSWVACLLVFLALTFMSFSVSGGLPSRTHPDDGSTLSVPKGSMSSAAQATSSKSTTSQEVKPVPPENISNPDLAASQAESPPASEAAAQSPGGDAVNSATEAAESSPSANGNGNSEASYDHPEARGRPDARRLNTQALRMLSETPPDLSGARRALEEASQLNPSDIEILNNLGDVYGRIGEYRLAEAVLLRVLNLAPNRRVALGNLGSVEAKLGRTEGAANYFCQYVRQFDSLDHGKSTLQRVMVDPDPNVQEAVRATIANCTGIAPSASQRSDGQIEIDVVHALKASKALEKDLIIAQTIRTEVWLSGTVSNEASKELAEWDATHVPGVTKVHNNLNVQLR